MDNKELRKLGRKELLEVILAQTKRIEELEILLKKTTNSLNSKKIQIEESGSLAEAVAKISQIFETAQKTADLYLENIKDKAKKNEAKMLKEYEKEKQRMLKKVAKECDKKRQEADEYIKDIEEKVRQLVKDNDDIPVNIKKAKRKKS